MRVPLPARPSRRARGAAGAAGDDRMPLLRTSTVNRRLLRSSTAIAAAAATILLAACNKAPPPAPVQPTPQPVLQGNQLRFPAGSAQLALLRTYTAAPSKAVPVDLPAKLVWNEERTQRIYPPFAGRVVAIKAFVGQQVSPGTALAEMASPDFGQAQADASRSQTDLALARKSLQRQQELYDAGIVARKEVDQLEAEAQRAATELARTQARVKLYGAGRTTSVVDQQLHLVSGIHGVVVERNINPGQEVRPDQMGPGGVPALFVISDPSTLWVQIDARETEVASLRPGAEFELSFATLPGVKVEGTVINAADFIDPTTRTIKVRGIVPNPKRLLKAEMLATARFQRSVSAGVVVPAAAVLLRGEKHLVFVQVQPGVFEPRSVQLGYQGPNEVVVSWGLEVGEQVVTDNVLLLARQYRVANEAAKASDPNANNAPPAEPPRASISARSASESVQRAATVPSAPAPAAASTPAAGAPPSSPDAAASGAVGRGGTAADSAAAASAVSAGDAVPLPRPPGTAVPAGDALPQPRPPGIALPAGDGTPAPRPPGAAVGGEAAREGSRP